MLSEFRTRHSTEHEPGISFQVTGETLIRRSDDNPEALKKRLATYHRETVPLVGFYKTRNLHRMVDASQKTEVVFDNIKKIFADARGEHGCFRLRGDGVL